MRRDVGLPSRRDCAEANVTKIVKGMLVKVSVELTQTDGTPIESSSIDYVHGSGRMLRGLEAALEGMEIGQAKEGVLGAKDAFGLEDDLPTMSLPRAELPKDAKMEPGRVFAAKDPQGKPVSFRLLKVEGDHCAVRLMHPLAGKDVKYKVKVVSVSDPKAIPVPPAEAFLAPGDLVVEDK